MRLTRARLLSIAGWAGFAAVVAGTLLVFSARWFWLGEIAASLAWYLGWASLAGAAFLAVTGKLRLGLAVLVVAGLHLWPELSLWIPDRSAGAPAAARGELSIASCNLLWTNTRFDAFRSWVEGADPDVVACLEVSTAWRRTLEDLLEEYPYQLYAPAESWDESTWGTVLLSRLPFESTRLVPIEGADTRPAMECVVRVGGQAVTVRGAHPMRPGRPWRIALRNAVLDTLARQTWDSTGILIGDLNMTASSPAYGDLLDAAGLRDSRCGFGRLPSYRIDRILPGLEVAIDHILVGEAFEVLERRTDPMPGSDHRAVFARLALR